MKFWSVALARYQREMGKDFSSFAMGLRAALRHLEPRITAAMDQAAGSPSDGLLGAICSKCFKQTEEVILCDGAGGAECNEEWCFACAGVAALPEGDWRCTRCLG